MAESRPQVVSGTGQAGTALAAHHLQAISMANALAVHVRVLRKTQGDTDFRPG